MNSTEIEAKLTASGLTDRDLYNMLVGTLIALEITSPGITDSLIVKILEVRHSYEKKNEHSKNTL